MKLAKITRAVLFCRDALEALAGERGEVDMQESPWSDARRAERRVHL